MGSIKTIWMTNGSTTMRVNAHEQSDWEARGWKTCDAPRG